MKLILIGQIKYSGKHYKKDFLRYYFYKKRFALFEIIGFIACYIATIALCNFSIIEKKWIGLSYFFGIMALTFVIFESYNLIVVFIDIQKKSKQLTSKKQEIKVFENRIDFYYGKQLETVFFSQIKKLKTLSKTLYLIPKDKNVWPFRLNSNEINQSFITDLEKIASKKLKKLHVK